MPSKFPYLGSEARQYTQYVDGEGGPPLLAEPGKSYNPVIVPGEAGSGLSEPPADGLWGEDENAKKDTPAPANAPAPAQPAAAKSDEETG